MGQTIVDNKYSTIKNEPSKVMCVCGRDNVMGGGVGENRELGETTRTTLGLAVAVCSLFRSFRSFISTILY